MTAEQLLERGLNMAENGVVSPLVIVTELALLTCGTEHFAKDARGRLVPHSCGGDHAGVWSALSHAAGGSLVAWCLQVSPRDTVQLFRDALFAIQLAA